MPTTTNYIWDEDNLLAEADGSNTVQTVYTNEPQEYGNLVSTRISSTTLYHHYDGIRSTRQLTNAVGAVTDRMTYDSWGNIVSRTGTSGVMLLWIGELDYYFDPETGLYYVRARILGPVIGRWTAVDPSGMVDGLDLYVYVRNRPLRLFDPSGLDSITINISGPGKWPTRKVTGSCPGYTAPGSPTPPPGGGGLPPQCSPANAGGTTPTTKDCEVSINGYLITDPIAAAIIAYLNDYPRLCKKPAMWCRCCTGAGCTGVGAFYDPPSNTIYICDEKGPTGDKLLNLLRHELTHAYQACRDKVRANLGLGAAIPGGFCDRVFADEFQSNFCAARGLSGGPCTVYSDGTPMDAMQAFDCCISRSIFSACQRGCSANIQTIAQNFVNWYAKNYFNTDNDLCGFPRPQKP